MMVDRGQLHFALMNIDERCTWQVQEGWASPSEAGRVGCLLPGAHQYGAGERSRRVNNEPTASLIQLDSVGLERSCKMLAYNQS